VSEDDRQADLLRQFEAITGGVELDDLRQLAGARSRSVSGRENRHGLDAPSCAGPGSKSCSSSW
jgi:hypothetical protein